MSEKTNPFEIINSIHANKNVLQTDYDGDLKMFSKVYSAFLTNRALSYFPDTIVWGNEMNQRSAMPADQQFLFHLNTVRKRKRFSKWSKPSKAAILSSISEYFQCNMQRAAEYDRVLTEEQKKVIVKRLEKGGKK